jgi:hypothetical protein
MKQPMQMFFRHEVHDISERTGWAPGKRLEARMNEFTLECGEDGDGRAYTAYLKRGNSVLLEAQGEGSKHAIELLESKVRMLRTGLESLTAP